MVVSGLESPTDLVLVGQRGGTNVGASLRQAALRAGLATVFVDSGRAWAAPRAVRALSWRLAGHRPPRIGTTSEQVLELCRAARPRWMLSTGFAPINARALRAIGDLGVTRMNYLTDDPWNPGQRARWFFDALREYDHIFSVRRANLDDLTAHGCRQVTYVPFAFDPEFARPDSLSPEERNRFDADVVFVGGADQQRLPFILALSNAGFDLALYGDYWARDPRTRPHARGHADPVTICKATLGARVAVCLVRRANRDGQVMRSYEAGAIGACMLVEDTLEHRELFGADSENVVYFHDCETMVMRLRELLDAPAERQRLAAAVRRRISDGGHTYDDRLRSMLAIASEPGVMACVH
jgi:hypothetical protein